jgi:predicted permease
MQTLLSDLVYGLRELRKRPGFTLTAVISLALGIGATTAVFSVIYAVLINPFPYREADRIVELHLKDKSGNERSVSLTGPEIAQLRKARSIENVVALDEWNLTTTDSDLPEDVSATYLSGDAAEHFGIPALLGRWLIPSDAPYGQEPQRVVVLTYKFWQRYYGGDPAIVGRTLQLVHKNYQVVGVMPPRFRWHDCDIYVPQKLAGDPNFRLDVSLRLRSGVTLEQANTDLQPIFEHFARVSPASFPDKFRVNVRSIVDLYARPLGPVLYLLLGAVGLLLVIGCTNVSILLLARGRQRQHELAVRAAIGASRSRIVRQLLTESFTIAMAGTLLGVLLAWKGVPLIAAWLPAGSFPSEAVITINVPVLLFSVGLAFLTALVFGISPALQLSRTDIGGLMQSSTRRIAGAANGHRTHNVLVASQVALTLLLLTSAGAAAKGFLRLTSAELGYDPRNTMSVPIPVHQNAYITWKERTEYFEQLRAKIASMPEVETAALSTNATPPSNGNESKMEVMGDTAKETPRIRLNFVSPEYFPALRIPLMEGRVWDRVETMRGAPVAVINRTMAKRYWPNGGAIGKQVRFPAMTDSPPYSPAAPGSDGWMQIIGVVADVRNDGLRNPVKPAVYVSYAAKMRMNTQILVHARVTPLTILRAVREQLVQVDPEQQVMGRVRDLNEWITSLREYAQQRLVAMLFGIFSMLALALAAVGLYSVVSYGVASRTNEFGVRMALGARRTDVIRVVLAATALNVGGGIVAGLVLSFVLDRIEAKWVTESSRDPLLLAGVSLVLILAAALAGFLPARRAASVDPMVALRYE